MRLVPVAMVSALCLAGCMKVGPDYQTPKLPIAKQWATPLPASPTTQQSLQTWWQQFNDAELNRLVNDALLANLDLRQSLIKIKDLRAQRASIFADALPEVSAKSNISRRYNNSAGAAQSGANQGGGFGIGNNLTTIFQSGFDAQWELDFFGGVQRALEAADATIASEQENSRAVQVTLLAEVARYYLQLRENQQLLAITESNLQSQLQTWQLLQVRQQAGFTSQLEASQAEAQAAEIQAQLPLYQIQIQQAIHALSVLLAKQPQELANRLLNAAEIPEPKSAIWPDLPSELLQRRPDIRRAERQLAAASANIGVATSALYPKLNLTAFLGLQNMKITDATPIGKSWSTAASLSMPLFNWGKLSANIDSKKAQAEQLGLAYQAAVLVAFKEVEDALVAYNQEQQRRQALQQAVAANQLAVSLAQERYQKGLTGFLDVLLSQQALYQVQTKLVNSKAAVSADLVGLYKALGGGWQASAALSQR